MPIKNEKQINEETSQILLASTDYLSPLVKTIETKNKRLKEEFAQKFLDKAFEEISRRLGYIEQRKLQVNGIEEVVQDFDKAFRRDDKQKIKQAVNNLAHYADSVGKTLTFPSGVFE